MHGGWDVGTAGLERQNLGAEIQMRVFVKMESRRLVKSMKTIMEMKKSDFKEVPHARWNEILEGFSSLVIIPTKRKHDSGYMCMEFCAVDDNDMPIAILSGCSDVLHIDGIGGYGDWKKSGKLPTVIPPKGWSMDCLPCGYLRLFTDIHNGLKSGYALSSFEVFCRQGR